MSVAPAAFEAPGGTGHVALKDNEAFLVADVRGDVAGNATGLFRDDTRLLSEYRLSVGGQPASLLRSGVSRDNVVFRAHLTNRRLPELGGRRTPEGVVHLERERVLWNGRVHEQLTLTNYGTEEVIAPLEFHVGADFADIFEVRGHVRERRGDPLPTMLDAEGATFRYHGRDGVLRSCTIAFSRSPDEWAHGAAHYRIALAPHGSLRLQVEIGPGEAARPSAGRFRHAKACARLAMRAKRRRGASIRCAPGAFDRWLDTARADLALLTTELSTGPYPVAGIPWFAAPFGRDGIVTALQTLWFDPSLARGVLAFLAACQARTSDPFRDARPGKILHESRKGEMAALGEVPFGRYYGGVDSTPLFLMLAGAYVQRTGDLAFVDALWPALEAANAWIDGEGDANGDGFVVYAAARATGLVNQGWKDSGDSMFHVDGRTPDGPIALVEVQGYVYAAKRAMAALAQRRGDVEAAQRWRNEAQALRERVEAAYWLPEHSFYAMALDGHGAPCRVRASNAGHLLYARLPEERRARAVADALMSTAFDDGWGLRTLAHGEARFNPMSYHNGSIWPHDAAICAAGMARYGERNAAARVLRELFDAAIHFGSRLPELYCGFARRTGEPPVGYPVACLPQAWSSGAVFMLLEACLGLAVDGMAQAVRIDRPVLPPDVDRLDVRGLDVGGARLDLRFERREGYVEVVAPRGVPAPVALHVAY